MLCFNSNWSDLGSWASISENIEINNVENSFFDDVVSINSSGNYVHAPNKLVGILGLENFIIVDTPDALLVCSKDQSENVRLIVDKLEKSNRKELETHRKVYRPWGWYDTIDNGEMFKVKRIRVDPGASLSLQKHIHRAEHWIVVKGIAEVIKGNEKMTLNENQSTYIPLKEIHRLSNPSKKPLEIIEVQTGKVLKESDIVRLEDKYNR